MLVFASRAGFASETAASAQPVSDAEPSQPVDDSRAIGDAALPAAVAERSADEGPARPFEERLGASASIRGAVFSKDLSFGPDTGYGVTSAWFFARPDEVWGVRARVEARVQAQNVTRESQTSLTWDLRDGYLERSFGPLDLRVGRQITVWGRADKLNPTDVWTSRDLKLLTTSDEDQRLGEAEVQAGLEILGARLIVLWQPEFRMPILPIPAPPPGVSYQNVLPTHPASQLGVKLDHSGGSADWSFSYAHVVNRIPDLSILSSDNSGAVIGLAFDETDVVGADGALTLGSFGLRGEAAYTRISNVHGADALTQRPMLVVL